MKTILVVDDELANADALALLLEEEGYRVVSAANGERGLERAYELHPQLVILDLMMPVMNGAQMAQAMRADPVLAPIKILMNSSLGEDVVRARFDGYDVFLRKPYTAEVILEQVRRLIGI